MSTGDLVTVTRPDNNTPDWELARQWRRAWAVLKFSFTALVVILFLVVIGQGFLFYQMFDAVHPALGVGFAVLLAGLLAVLVGRPLVSFFRTPVMAEPPAMPVAGVAVTAGDLAARIGYDLKYLKALARNPALTAEQASIEADMEKGRALLARARAEGADLDEVSGALARFEADAIEARLVAIDAEVDRMIHAEAVGVGVATAISMNGTVDAFIVLWRNANLVAQVARAYFGRPHLRGSLMILRDVAAIVVISRAVDDITDMTGELIGGLLGRMGGLVAGPVMDGAVNSMMTLKLGYLAKRRCRSFKGWSPAQAPSITASALARVKRESGSVAADLLKRCGGLTATAAKATTSVMEGSKTAWGLVQSWFGVVRVKTASDEAAET